MKNKEIVIDTRLNTILFDNTKYYDVPKEILSYIEQLENNRNRAIEYIEKHTDKIKKIVIPKIDFNYKKILNILKGDSDE